MKNVVTDWKMLSGDTVQPMWWFSQAQQKWFDKNKLKGFKIHVISTQMCHIYYDTVTAFDGVEGLGIHYLK